MPRLGRPFFARSSPAVARELLGCWLVSTQGGGEVRVLLTEAEAYLGADDPASHAFRGRTKRNLVMFGPAGHAYVYLIYGMHHCLNVVTGADGDAQAVLIRGAIDRLTPGRQMEGPGRLTRALGIDRRLDGVDLCRPNSPLWLESAAPVGDGDVEIGPRVGVADPAPLRYRLRSAKAKKWASPEGSPKQFGALHTVPDG